MERRQLIDWLRRETAMTMGRRYRVDYEVLDTESLRELVRLLRDMESAKEAAVNQVRRTPWRL
jgi:hypothetical protein